MVNICHKTQLLTSDSDFGSVLFFIGVVSEMGARPTFTISTLTRCVPSQGELWGHSDMHSVYGDGRDTDLKLRIHKQHYSLIVDSGRCSMLHKIVHT